MTPPDYLTAPGPLPTRGVRTWQSRLAPILCSMLVLGAAEAGRAQPGAVVVGLTMPVPGARAADSLVLTSLWTRAAEKGAPVIGALRALQAAGGTLETGRSAGGVWALASAPADAAGFAVTALEAFWLGDIEPGAEDLRLARSEALKERAWAAARQQSAGARALWRSFYGQPPPLETHEIPDLAIARVQLEDLRALVRAWQERPGPALFVTGPVASDDLRRLQSRLPGPRNRAPLPLHPGPQHVAAPADLAADRVVLAQVLPVDARLHGPPGAYFLESVRRQLSDLGAAVRFDFRPRGGMLVVDVAAQGKSAAEHYAEISARLRELRANPPANAPLRASGPTPPDESAAPLSIAAARARRYLLLGDVGAPEPLPPADALRRWLMPEAMRMTSQPAGAPSRDDEERVSPPQREE